MPASRTEFAIYSMVQHRNASPPQTACRKTTEQSFTSELKSGLPGRVWEPDAVAEMTYASP